MDPLCTYVTFSDSRREGSDSSMKALEYSDDDTSLSTIGDDLHLEQQQFSVYEVPPTRVLLIDEVETKRINPKECTVKKIKNHDKNDTTSPHRVRVPSLRKMTPPVPCSCCKSYVECKQTKKSNLIASSPSKDQSALSSFFDLCTRSLINDEEDTHGITRTRTVDTDQTQATQDQPAKFEYTITKILMENWLSKKGSGNDIFGSTSWKPRWCQLVLAKVPFYEVEVPLLLVSWHFTMPKPSTIIILDKKIAIGIDALGNTTSKTNTEYAYRFDVVLGDKSSPSSSSGTRSFSASTIGQRNSWADAINDAISSFERSRKSYRRAHSSVCLPPTIPRTASARKSKVTPGKYTIDDSDLEGLDLVY